MLNQWTLLTAVKVYTREKAPSFTADVCVCVCLPVASADGRFGLRLIPRSRITSIKFRIVAAIFAIRRAQTGSIAMPVGVFPPILRSFKRQMKSR